MSNSDLSPKNAEEIIKRSFIGGSRMGNPMNESGGSFSMIASPKNTLTIDGKQYQKDKEGNYYVMEQVDISDTGDEESEEEEAPDIEDIDEIEEHEDDLKNFDKFVRSTVGKSQMDLKKAEEVSPKAEQKKVLREMVLDDFIRNFLVKHQMNRTLEAFQQEYYELVHKGKFSDNDLGMVPDIYFKNEKLEERLQQMNKELNAAKLTAEKAKETWDKLRRERDFHKMHHSRVQQEKSRLNQDIDRLKRLHREYEDKYQDLSMKYEAAMKEKMLLKLERDRLVAKSESLEKTLAALEAKIGKDSPEKSQDKLPDIRQSLTKLTKIKAKPTSFPAEDRINPYMHQTIDAYVPKGINLSKAFKKAHMMPISSIAMHSKKSIIATASDDMTWKIWTIPNGELIMSGEGHKDWVSGIDFHPKGTHMATCSGDSTIKVWDFVHATCMHTFKDHIQPVWNVKFNDTGDFLISCSMDHTCKLFDVNYGKHRQTFRGHVDSVNHAIFLPYTNTFATASADKTISLWDMRTALCVQTFYGHMNTVNHVATSVKAENLVSSDSDGIVKVWDIRMVKQRSQIDTGNYSANSCAMDKSGSVIAVATDDGFVKVYTESTGKQEAQLRGHEDSVQDVVFDYNSRMIVSVGSDASIIIWQ